MRFFSKRTFELKINNCSNKKVDQCQGIYQQRNGEPNNIAIPSTEEKPIKNASPFNEYQIDESKYTKPEKENCLIRRIHILKWIKNYNQEMAVADLIAGITLGMTIIPQSIAYAALAGLSSEYGLYSAFIGSIIYVFFGTIPQVSIGPTSLMALMVLQFCADKPIQFVIVLAFLSGLVEFLMGVFELGFIVNFIPGSVNKAFTTATSLIICLAQLKNLFGVKIKGIPSLGDFWHAINYPDAIIGLGCITVLLILRKLNDIKFETNSPSKQMLKKMLWYLSISRNAIVVFFCALATFLWVGERSREAVPFALSANAEAAKISIHVPPFAFEYQNTTYVFVDICRELGSAIFVVPLVSVLANVAIAKAFVKDGKLDASQEMLTLGLCNIAGSFFSAMPTCGAFTRSAVSQASGVRTPMSGIYIGLLVFSALSVLTPYFKFIPKASLSAVLIAAVIFMMDFNVCKKYWITNKKDFFSWVCSFIICVLVGVEAGLFFGIVLNMIFVVIRLGIPKVEINLRQVDEQPYIHIVCHSDIYYTGVEHLRSKIREACVFYKNDFPLVIECSRFLQFDSTFVDVIMSIARDLEKQGVLMILQNMKPETQMLMTMRMTNIRYCSGEVTLDDLVLKN